MSCKLRVAAADRAASFALADFSAGGALTASGTSADQPPAEWSLMLSTRSWT